MKNKIGISILMLFLVLSSAYSAKINEVTQLVCEYHSNPIGIDVEKPRLSWQITSVTKAMQVKNTFIRPQKPSFSVPNINSRQVH